MGFCFHLACVGKHHWQNSWNPVISGPLFHKTCLCGMWATVVLRKNEHARVEGVKCFVSFMLGVQCICDANINICLGSRVGS